MSNELYRIIANAFSISESDINDKSGPENIEAWDSFNGLVLVDELENHFNIKLAISILGLLIGISLFFYSLCLFYVLILVE